ncbi:MAG: hypothetical protein PUI16_10040 [Clostridia bacterium]|nr:hypothetical protein [Clostridia bacterium]MDY5554439.1 hypothetical protein [Blautia sp.]
MRKWKNYLITGMIVLMTVGICGCGGVSHKSPEKVTEELIQSSVNGKEKKILDCYLETKNTEDSLKSEVDTLIKYYKSHNVKKLKIQDCDTLSENEKYTYVYITYNLVLDDDQEYPCIGTYMVGKKDKDYYILPPSQITDEMRNQAASDYARFMTTDTYKEYTKDYDTFIKNNPGYEDKISEKMK